LDEARAFADSLLKTASSFIIEEKLIGQEFSLLSFSDGKTLKHMPLVQDHKRAFVGDTGPNTGGMGTYTAANHRLPFLSEADYQAAVQINEATIAALLAETGEPYCGILYGGFMQTRSGIKVLEFNARFGDPEALNLLTLLRTDFITICQAMIHQTLADCSIEFAPLASVCKYLVPTGYPDHPIKGEKISVPSLPENVHLFYASIEERSEGLYLLGSRALALLGLGSSIAEAEKVVSRSIDSIQGPLFYRPDIGTAALVNQRIIAANQLLNTDYPLES
jgi:phosphoribosylamine--glycine ligase